MRATLLVSFGAAVLLAAVLAHVGLGYEPEKAGAHAAPKAIVPAPSKATAARLTDSAVLEQLLTLSDLDGGYVTRATFEFERAHRVSWTLEGVILENGAAREVVAVATFDPDGRVRFHASKGAVGTLPKGAPSGERLVEILSSAAAPPSLLEAAGSGDRLLMIYDHARGPPYTATEVPAFTLAGGRLAPIATGEARAPVLRLVALQDRGLHGFHGEERAIVSLGDA